MLAACSEFIMRFNGVGSVMLAVVWLLAFVTVLAAVVVLGAMWYLQQWRYL
jgi:hypothetical protein